MSENRLMAAVKKATLEVNSFEEIDLRGIVIPVIAIYKHPEDYPRDCVARIFEGDQPTNILIRRQTVEEIREDIIKAFPWMVRFDRSPEDLPSLVETWL